MDSRPLLPNEEEEEALPGVSDFRGRPVYRATSGGWRSALFVAGMYMYAVHHFSPARQDSYSL